LTGITNLFFYYPVFYGGISKVTEHLEEVRKVKNIPVDEGCFGGTPFTLMTIIMDYNINIYRYIDGYS
jgi:hypothetical protein